MGIYVATYTYSYSYNSYSLFMCAITENHRMVPTEKLCVCVPVCACVHVCVCVRMCMCAVHVAILTYSYVYIVKIICCEAYYDITEI